MSEQPDELVTGSEPRPGVVQLTLCRPDRLNALTAPLVAQLHEQLRAVAADLTCRVVGELTGAGRGFCAGLDLAGFGTIPGTEEFGRGPGDLGGAAARHRRPGPGDPPSPPAGHRRRQRAGRGRRTRAGLRQRHPDRVSERGRSRRSFIRIGVTGCDIGTSWLLPRLVGAARAHELMLTRRRFDAAEALRIGLVTDVGRRPTSSATGSARPSTRCSRRRRCRCR